MPLLKLSKNCYIRFPTRGKFAWLIMTGVMVELTGIEPATSGLQNRRSPN